MLKPWQIKAFDEAKILGWEKLRWKEPENSRRNLSDVINTAKQLSESNNGFLPSYIWLKNNNYVWLIGFMQRHPLAFIEFTQDKLHGISLAKRIEQAEYLAKLNNGLLPSPSKLNKINPGLYYIIRHNKAAFNHISKEYEKQTIEKLIERANNLAINGVLPNYSKLYSIQEHALLRALKRYPKKFKHLKISSLRKTDKEAVELVETLILSNNGKLPTHKELKKLGHDWLSQRITKKPYLFNSIDQDVNQRSPNDWLIVCRMLVDKFGYIPREPWLENNGYGGLAQAMRKHKILIDFVAYREKTKQSKADHQKAAVNLVLEKGCIPNHSWLKKNGYSALADRMQKKPEWFVDFPKKK